MSARGELCFRISKSLIKPPSPQAAEAERYSEWRVDEMVRSWSHFSNAAIDNKDVLDFGCGDGPLSLHLALTGEPRSITGVDLDPRAIERAKAAAAAQRGGGLACVPEFLVSEAARIPVDDSSIDCILAFDCMEHIMNPAAIMSEWRRVLRPGGRILIEWFPFKGPWGPHMHNLIPLPWAHVLFGERALFEAAERLYDDSSYVPRHWDFDENGERRANSWRNLRSFRDAGYLNQLDIAGFKRLATEGGFTIARLEAMPLGGTGAKRLIGQMLLTVPIVSEYATSFIVAELQA